MKSKLNIYLFIFMLIPICLVTITYSAFNEEMIINGEAILRVDENIRITDIKVIEQTNEAYETYNNKFDKERTSMFVTLPNINSTLTYEVTLTNNSNIAYDVNDIIIENYSNNSIKYEIDLSVGDIIEANTSKTFTVKFYYNTSTLPDDITNTLIIKYEFVERVVSYVVAYEYTEEEEFVAPYDGIYKLEVWGAQGGSYSDKYHGGYGGYSVAYVNLEKDDILYVNVGGAGSFTSGLSEGGYNGGGNSTLDTTKYTGSGGGATHIALESGLLSELSEYSKNNNSPILIVAGGGGGASQDSGGTDFGIGGNGGGITGNDGTSEYNSTYIGYGGTQTAGGASKIEAGSFGQGGNASTSSSSRGGGGGAGYYGGGSGYKNGAAGGGGSGYIANNSIYNKYMVCYDCETSSELATLTYSLANVSEMPKSNYSKMGNGYAKITFVNETEEKQEYDFLGIERNYTITTSGVYKLEVWGAQGGSYNDEYHGGYGGYSVAYVNLEKDDILYINVGGAGSFTSGISEGGYNGGGDSTPDTTKYTGSGGGATHIALESGLLSELSEYSGNDNSPILIVAGGGGGASQNTSGNKFGIGGNGGGVIGTNGTSEYDETYIGYGGTQTAGGASKIEVGSFGQGGNASTKTETRGGGGGAGYYGGGSGYKYGAAGGGGSGYIANNNLYDKYMVCYNCETSEELNTKTNSTTNVSENPTSDYAKIGNGYAKITFITE